MPVVTLDSFLANLTKSNLLTTEQLQEIRSELDSTSEPIDPKQLAQKLVQQQLLTRWQAGILLAGRSAFFLGKYKLLRELGRGGMGAVFQAEQQPLGRVVALKVMSRNMMKDQAAIARFHREIQAAAALQHPNIVAALDADNAQNTHFLVMEFVEGEDLGEIAKREGKLPCGTACEYIRQAALGLQHAHERGMAHRDIKPSNLLLTWKTPHEPVVKILDMGLARFTSETGEESGLTQTGQIMGTPDYIAPEQAQNTKSADIRSDIFSLGCSLFRLISGQLPYGGSNVMEKLMARAIEDAPQLRSVFPGTPPELELVVAKMLARNPADRYQTPGELAEVLLPFSTNLESDPAAIPQSMPPVPASQTSFVSMDVDAGMGQFLQDLSNEAAEELAPAETINSTDHANLSSEPTVAGTASSEDANKLTRGGIKLQQQLELRKAAERKRLVLILAGVVASILSIASVVVWQKLGKTTMIVDWPLDERQGAKLTVDGMSIKIGKSAQLSFPGDLGERTIKLSRKGYKLISKKLNFGRGETQTIQPKWEPTLETQRTKKWELLSSEFASTIAKFPNQRPSWNDESIVKLRDKLKEFRDQWIPQPESLKARSLLARLPGPFDELVSENSPETDPPLNESVPLVRVLGAQDLKLAHWGAVTSVLFTPDDRNLISAGGGMIRIWDTKDGRQINRISQPSFKIALSPDGKTLAAGFHDCVLWDRAALKKLPNQLKHEGNIYSLAFSSDGKYLATASSEGTTKLWDASSWKELKVFPGTNRLNCVVFSPDSQLLATGGHEMVVKVWDVESGNLKKLLKGHKNWITSIAFSADGQHLITSAANDRAIVWELKDEQEISTTTDGHFQFSHDGETLVRWSHNSTIILDQKTLQKDRIIPHGGGSMSFSHDDRLIATGSRNGTVRLWNRKTGEPVVAAPEPSGIVQNLSVSSDGRLIAAGDSLGQIRIYEIPSCKEIHNIKAHSAGVSGLEFSPSKNRLLSTGDGYAFLWDSTTGERLRSCPERAFHITAFSPEGKIVAMAGEKGTILLWNTESGELLKTLNQGDNVQSLAFSLDGKLLASGSGDHVVKIWNVESGEEAKKSREVEYYAYSLVFTPDGENLVASSRTVWFWNLNNGLRTKTILKELFSLSFSPDGRFFAGTTGYPPSNVRLYETSTGQLDREFTIAPSLGTVQKVAFTPDGRHLITANGNGTIYVLRLEKWSTGTIDKD